MARHQRVKEEKRLGEEHWKRGARDVKEVDMSLCNEVLHGRGFTNRAHCPRAPWNRLQRGSRDAELPEAPPLPQAPRWLASAEHSLLDRVPWPCSS